MSMYFEGHPGYPNGWYDNGPFGIWNHPDGYLIVGMCPGYALSKKENGKRIELGEFDDLYTAMVSVK